MTKRHGYALLSAFVALVVAFSVTMLIRSAAGDSSPGSTATGRGSHGSSAATWVGSWAASPVGAEPGIGTSGLAGHSVRNVVHANTGGTSARVTLSNLYGRAPLTITHASVALSAGRGTAAARAETMRRLKFDGAYAVTIPAGQQVRSDAVRIAVPRDSDVLVTTYAVAPSGPVTYHPHARQISYLAEGDRTEESTGVPYTKQTSSWRYLTALDVLTEEAHGTVVAFGDSITDGISSTTGENHRWPDVLASRLRSAAGHRTDAPRYSVVNEGISGNRVLTAGPGSPAQNPSGLSRFGRDALGHANVKVVVIDLGVNDILRSKAPGDRDKILDGLRTLVRQAHARGLKVVGATLTPFGGRKAWTPARELMRRQINAEIRSGRVFDAVVDFDSALKDPAAPQRLLPAYDSGDHLHPSDVGYRKMADVFNLRLLEGAGQAEL
ncbi:SGNH/GDSL hydrolase family protein [Streptomyces sp. NPDC003435]